jgi:hypothetical protein
MTSSVLDKNDMAKKIAAFAAEKMPRAWRGRLMSPNTNRDNYGFALSNPKFESSGE